MDQNEFDWYSLGGQNDGFEEQDQQNDEYNDYASPYDFDILEDIDTLLFSRLNSFYHSLTNEQLDMEEFEQMNDENETGAQLANDERKEFLASKINYFFHQLRQQLSPEQQNQVHLIHSTINIDIAKICEYFHQRTVQILTPH